MTLTELTALSPDELRVMVAELMGWGITLEPHRYICGPIYAVTTPRGSTTRGWNSSFRTAHSRTGVEDSFHPFQTLTEIVEHSSVPNYTGSLDSCREFEDAMTDEECDTYGLWLNTIMVGDSKTDAIREVCDWYASARQKCIAYILTKQATKTEGAE